MHTTLVLSLLILLFTPSLAAPQFGGGFGSSTSTSNDLLTGPCKSLIYIFARGTGEGGNMGSSVGPALATELKSRFSNDVAVQGVDYPASVNGVVVGSMNPAQAAGAKKMVELVKQAKTKCPSTKIILAGYSQGAQQVHGALIGLTAGDVDAAVTFGDPLQRQAFRNIDASKTKIFCNPGDSVCNNSFVITPAHLSYARNSIKPAGDFLVSVL